MRYVTTAVYITHLSHTDVADIRNVMSRSGGLWLGEAHPELSAWNWYELGQKLRRKSVAIDVSLDAVHDGNPFGKGRSREA